MTIQGISQLTDVQEMERRDDIVPADPNYIPNTDEPTGDGLESPDTSGVDSPSGSPSSPPPSGKKKKSPKSGDENYIPNSDQYNEETNPVSTAADALNSGEEYINDLFNDLGNGEDYVQGGEDEYQRIYGEKLAELLKMLTILTNYELGIKMLAEAQFELSDKIREIVLEVAREEEDVQADRSQYFKNAKERLQLFQQFIIALYKKVYNHNLKLYQKRLKEIDDERRNASGWAKFCNWFDSHLDEKAERKRKKETQKLNQALSQNLDSLRGALGVFISAYVNSDKQELKGLGGALNDLDQKIEEAKKTLDQRVTHNTDYFDEDDIRNMFQDILRDVRAKMVKIENLNRAMVFLQTAQQDLSDSIRESVLEISSHSSKAEYGLVASEGFSKAVNLLFDTTFNTLMMRVRFFNQEVRSAKNLEKIRQAKWWNFAAKMCLVVAGAASLALGGVLIAGGAAALAPLLGVAVGTAETIMGTVAIGAGVLGLASGVLMGVGSYLAYRSVRDSFNAGSPDFTFDLLLNNKKTGNSAADAINKVEREEEILAQYLAASEYMKKTSDGFYVLNAKALAGIEIGQQRLHNLVKYIMYLAKAQRDISRSITGIVLEKGIRDHGEGYLLNNIENSLHQRSLLLQAIKFQLQEMVTGKNIAVQNDMAASKALWTGLSTIIGAGAGLLLLLVPGIGGIAGLGFCIGIGSTLGSSIYQFIDAVTSKALGMDLQMSSPQLDRLLEQRGKNAKSGTPEDKLYELENRLYYELLSQGMVGVGDGYRNVNYTLVGKIYNGLKKIQLIREALSRLRTAQAKISAAVRQQVVGASSSLTELGEIQSKSGFSESMALVKGLTRFMQERAMVLNRARDADKAFSAAFTSLATNFAISLTGVGLTASGGALGTVAQAATPGAMSLVSALYHLGTSISSASSDMGAYENYSPEKAVKQIKGNKLKGDEDVFAKLGALEEEIYLEAGKNLARTLDGANWVVAGENSAILSQRLHALNNLRKMILTLISAKDQVSSAVRSRVGVASRAGEDLSSLGSIQDQVSQNILNSLVQGIDVIVERHNQISQSERDMWVSLAGIGLSVASVTLGILSSLKGIDMENAGKAYDSMSKRTDIEFSARARAEYKNQLRGDYTEFASYKGAFDVANSVTILLSILANYYVGVAYDADNNGKETEIKESALDVKKSSDKGTRKSALTDDSSGDIFSNLNSLETDANLSEIQMAMYSTPSATEIVMQRTDQLIKTWYEAIKQAGDLASKIFDGRSQTDIIGDVTAEQDDIPNIGLKSPKILKELFDSDNYSVKACEKFAKRVEEAIEKGTINKVKAKQLLEILLARPDLKDNSVVREIYASVAAGINAVPVQQQKPEPFKPETKQASSNKGLLDLFDQRMRSKETMERSQVENDFMKAQAEKAEEGVKWISQEKKCLEKEIGEVKTKIEKAQDPETLKELNQKLDALNARKAEILENLKNARRGLTEFHKELPKLEEYNMKINKEAEVHIVNINRRLNELSTKGQITPDEAEEQSKLRAEKKMLEQVKPQLDKEKSALKERAEIAKQKIGQLANELSTIQSQIVAVQRLIAEKEKEMKKEKERQEKVAKKAVDGPKEGIKKNAPVFSFRKPETYAEKAEQARLAEEGLAKYLAEEQQKVGALR